MSPSLRALLNGLIDYAGLFPPARLPLSESLTNYLRYRSESESWMLGRFICPASRLGELAGFADAIAASGDPLVCSALGRGGDTEETFLAGLGADLADIRECRRRHGGQVAIDVLEL